MVRDLYIVRDTHVNGEHKQTQQLVGNIEHFESEFVTLKAFNILNELPYIGNTI